MLFPKSSPQFDFNCFCQIQRVYRCAARAIRTLWTQAARHLQVPETLSVSIQVLGDNTAPPARCLVKSECIPAKYQSGDRCANFWSLSYISVEAERTSTISVGLRSVSKTLSSACGSPQTTTISGIKIGFCPRDFDTQIPGRSLTFPVHQLVVKVSCCI